MWFKLKTKRKIALVLSGGSARGLAHIGVIKVLKRERLKFDLVVGSSIGAMVGAAFCLDRSLDEIERLALRTTTNDLIDVILSRMGLTEGKKLENLIRHVVDSKGFADMKIPMAITAVDIQNGKHLHFTSGNLVSLIRASCSLPGVFRPVEYENKLLTDGGLGQHLPVDVAKKLGADFVVGVDVGFCVKTGKINNMLGVIAQAIQIMGEELSRHQSATADILIKPALGEYVDQLAFEKSAFIIKKGEEAAENALPMLKKYVGTY